MTKKSNFQKKLAKLIKKREKEGKTAKIGPISTSELLNRVLVLEEDVLELQKKVMMLGIS
jgi:hypothetical protein